MKKENLRPWLRDRAWLLPLIGVLLIALSPILMPVVVLWRVRRELTEGVADYLSECADAFKRVT